MNDTTLFINLKNLENNINQIKSLKLAKNKTIIAILKSDAYGHGIIPVANTLINNGVNFFGIVKMDEAISLHKNHPGAKLLMLIGISENDIKEALNMNLSIAAFSLDYIKFLLNKARDIKPPRPLNLHIKYDSGMNRLGLNDAEIKKAIEIIKKNKNLLNIEGIFSHLSSAGNDLEYTNFQLKNYKKILSKFKAGGITPEFTHISASSSLTNNKIEQDFSNAIRPGISLYGINPNQDNYPGLNLKPLMTLKSSIIQIKKIKRGAFISYNNTFKAPYDMITAIIPAGYDNGIPRLLSNSGRFLIRDNFSNIVGIVTMNMTIVDITKIKGVNMDDEVIIAGESLTKRIGLEEIALKARTIPYEICLNLGKSNQKAYIY
ncbi:MAG: alanine racemase [Candidatus Acidulodesulfobacterium ferriphilum]|uniref:Alanine racemase n=1 Tax=Candidatus Acidulodesulfobacterium ferriphilum TaxID=2597223 RepID=A0A519B949_9DELT|nr:MAG: alanine racemase [Candidatus Acidulodesulfobacterium ferriphilum]